MKVKRKKKKKNYATPHKEIKTESKSFYEKGK